MLKQKLWEIPRSDTRDRCAICLHVLTRGKMYRKSQRYLGQRYRNVHLGCENLTERSERLILKDMENTGTTYEFELSKTEGTHYNIILPEDPTDEVACDSCQ